MEIKEEEFLARASGEVAEKALGSVFRERVVQRERTKRVLIYVVSALFVVAVLAIVFAPPGREVVGWALGSVLIVLALGAIGASKFLLKVPGATVRTHAFGDGRHHDIKVSVKDDTD